MAHHAAEGDHVSALIVTSGVCSHDWQLLDGHKKADNSAALNEESARSQRSKRDEVRRACGMLNIEDLHFLDLEDDAELLTQEMIFQVAEKFREIRPDVVITHHPYGEGGFKMHATVGQAVMFARRACIRVHRSARQPLRIAATYFMNPMGYVNHNNLNQGVGFFRADVYVDITDVVGKKVQALDCIQSQLCRCLLAEARRGRRRPLRRQCQGPICRTVPKIHSPSLLQTARVGFRFALHGGNKRANDGPPRVYDWPYGVDARRAAACRPSIPVPAGSLRRLIPRSPNVHPRHRDLRLGGLIVSAARAVLSRPTDSAGMLSGSR